MIEKVIKLTDDIDYVYQIELKPVESGEIKVEIVSNIRFNKLGEDLIKLDVRGLYNGKSPFITTPNLEYNIRFFKCEENKYTVLDMSDKLTKLTELFEYKYDTHYDNLIKSKSGEDKISTRDLFIKLMRLVMHNINRTFDSLYSELEELGYKVSFIDIGRLYLPPIMKF